jgi:hypothetical protein
MPFPSFPELPEEDPLKAVTLAIRYVRRVLAYSPRYTLLGIPGVCVLAFTASCPIFGFDSTLSWASDLVPIAFAVAGIAFSIEELRDEHKTGTVVMIAVIGVLGMLVLHIARVRSEERIFAATNGIHLDILRNMPQATKNQQDSEIQRRMNINRDLRGEYILSHPNISEGLLTGKEDPPADWMNERLQELGENWRVREPETPKVLTATTGRMVPNSAQLVTGNLKQRALEFADKVRTDTRTYEGNEHPTTPAKEKAEAESTWFRALYLPEVRKLRDEFANLYLRNKKLDDLLEEEDEYRKDRNILPDVRPRTLSYWDYQDIANAFTTLAHGLP